MEIWEIIITIIEIAGILFAIFYTFYETNKTKKSELANTIDNFHRYIGERIENSPTSGDDIPKCKRFAIDFLHILNEMAFFYRQKIIDADVIEFFENNFIYGLSLIHWLNLISPIKVIEKDGTSYVKKNTLDKYPSLEKFLESQQLIKWEGEGKILFRIKSEKNGYIEWSGEPQKWAELPEIMRQHYEQEIVKHDT